MLGKIMDMLASTKAKIFFAILMLIPFCAGLGVNFLVGWLRLMSCNEECQAQLLYKNLAFYKAREIASSEEFLQGKTRIVDQTMFTKKFLHDSGVRTLAILPTGQFVLTSRFSNILMVATLYQEKGRPTWHCNFYDGTNHPPSARFCSY